MKRHERAALCIRLCNEMHENNVLRRLLTDLRKVIDEKHKNNRFKANKDLVYAIKATTYKGVAFYLIVDKEKDYDVVFNTSPIDAAFVEFIKAITEEAAIIYTQHALDRYNERIHADKYSNHRDIIKRFIVNNPVKTDIIIDGPDNKVIQRVNEGFLCGQLDKDRTYATMNTFYESHEYLDSEGKARARNEFKRYVEWPKERRDLYDTIHNNLFLGIINYSQYQYQMFVNGFDIEAGSTTNP